MRTSPLLATVVAGGLLLAACSGDPEPEPTPTPTVSATASPTPSTTPAIGPAAPLTGVPSADDELGARPVLAVKIENSPAARPQSGLAEADVVFEELVEGGLTRFIALFHSTVPEAIGPIRSARLVDVEILPPYEGVLAISGARDQVLRALSRAGVPFMADGTAFRREPGRRAPHNLYATGEGLWTRAEGIASAEPAKADWTFDVDPPEGAVDCDGDPVCLDAGRDLAFSMSRQSTTGWVWDRDTNAYQRLQNGVAFATPGGDTVTADNVVLLEMIVGDGECCDSNGSPLVHTTVTGEGRAVILRDGLWYEARWSKPSTTDPLVLLDADGEDFKLRPGRTWVHLAPRANVPDAP